MDAFHATHNETLTDGPSITEPIYSSTSIGGAMNGTHRLHPTGLHLQGQLNQPLRMDYHPVEARYEGHHELTPEEAGSIVFVGGLHPYIDDRMLMEQLSRFGNVTSIIRKHSKDSGSQAQGRNQYAFVRFGHPLQAENAVREGEIVIDGRKLFIRHRHERPPHRPNRPNVYGSPNSNHLQGYGENIEQTLDTAFATHQKDYNEEHQRRFNNGPRLLGQSPQHKHVEVSRQNRRSHAGHAPVLMDRDLVVANLPADMSPKEFFELFSEVGQVEGCFIFPQPDRHNRRFGHISMMTFFLAQKAVEAFNHYVIRNCQLEVGYKGNTTFAPPPVNLVGDGVVGPMQQQQSLHQQVVHHHQAMHQQAIYHQQAIHHPHDFQQMAMNGMQQISAQNLPSPHYRHVATPQFEHGSPPHMQQSFIPPPPGHIPPFRIMSGPLFNPVMEQSFPPMYSMPPNSPPKQNMQSSNPHPNIIGHGPVPEQQSFQNAPFLYNTSNDVAHQQNFPPIARCFSNDSQNSSRTLVSSPLVHNHSKELYGGMSPIEIPDHRSTPSPVILKSDPSQSMFHIVPTPIIPEAKKPSDPCNLFVKNLDDSVVSTSDDLKLLFENFGTTTSVSLATFSGSNVSRGYGFVAFADAEHAKKALEEVNNSLIGRKRVFVSYAERKEDRQRRLECIFNGIPLEEEDESKGGQGELDNQSESPAKDSSPESSDQQTLGLEDVNQEAHQFEKSSTASDTSLEESIILPVKEAETILAVIQEGSSENELAIISAPADHIQTEDDQVLVTIDDARARSLSPDENKPSAIKGEPISPAGAIVNKCVMKGPKSIGTLPSVAEADEDERQTSSSGSEKSFNSVILVDGDKIANRGRISQPVVKGGVVPYVPDIFSKLRKATLAAQGTNKSEPSPILTKTTPQDGIKTRAIHSDALVPACRIPTQPKNVTNVSKNRTSNVTSNNSALQNRTHGGSKKWRSNSNGARNQRAGAKNNGSGSGQDKKEPPGANNSVEQTSRDVKEVTGTVSITVAAH